MLYKEITPFLNKMVRVNLKNKKRKVGWLVVDFYHEASQGPLAEIHCVKVRFGEKHIKPNKNFDMKILKQNAETFKMEDIMDIRSCI